jgi:hypothetical protein
MVFGPAPDKGSVLSGPSRLPTPPPGVKTPESPTPSAPVVSQADFDAVQSLYNKHKVTTNCAEIQHIVREISKYLGDGKLVPEGARYSVLYPAKKADPTISDLPTDRITRIKEARQKCFT